MKSLGRYALVALIALAVGAFASSKWFTPEPEITTVTVIQTDTVYKTIIDTTGIVPIAPSTGELVTIELPDVSTPEPNDTIKVDTRQYVGTQTLENGTIDYTIFADSLYAVDFKLTTQDKIVTNNITTTITKVLPPKSMLFVGGGVDLSTLGTPMQASLGIMYNRRNKWIGGVSINKDLTGFQPATQTFSVGVRFYIPLFNKK